MPYPVGLVFRDGKPLTYDSGDYPACQAKAVELADYANFQPGGRRRARGPIHRDRCRKLRGRSGLGPFEGATVRRVRSGRFACSRAQRRRGRAIARRWRKSPPISSASRRTNRRRDGRHRRDRDEVGVRQPHRPNAGPAVDIAVRSACAKDHQARSASAGGGGARYRARPGTRLRTRRTADGQEPPSWRAHRSGSRGSRCRKRSHPGWKRPTTLRPRRRPIATAPTSPRLRSISRPATCAFSTMWWRTMPAG